MHESFLTYRRFFYLKVAAGLGAAAIAAYALHAPVDPPNGGTWLGYTLGVGAAALIVWLSWFGVRKRRYAHTQDRLAGWLSAHVYLGAALLLFVSLHCGMQFGWNVHTLAYVLTVLVVLTGIWGLYMYVSYPRQLTANRAGMSRAALIAEIADLDRECLVLADKVSAEAHRVVLKSVEETTLGGNLRDLLFGDPARRAASPSLGKGLEDVRRRLEQRVASSLPFEQRQLDTEQTAIGFLAGHGLADDSGPERLEFIRRLFDLITRRRALVERVQRDLQYQARLSFWLYLHVPLAVGLLMALLAHVFAVFFYW